MLISKPDLLKANSEYKPTGICIQYLNSTGIYMTVCKEYTLKSSLNNINFDICFVYPVNFIMIYFPLLHIKNAKIIFSTDCYFLTF